MMARPATNVKVELILQFLRLRICLSVKPVMLAGEYSAVQEHL